jgi:hypothetical protein
MLTAEGHAVRVKPPASAAFCGHISVALATGNAMGAVTSEMPVSAAATLGPSGDGMLSPVGAAEASVAGSRMARRTTE